MILTGILLRNGKLYFPTTILATYFGCLTGITLSYLLGRTAGKFLLRKYGSWIGITEKRLEQTHLWFQRFGKWTLAFGYFIPGVRHFTGFSAGMTYLEFKKFALFAYTGAFVWMSLFLSIGYFAGEYCRSLYETVEINLETVALIIILIAVCGMLIVLKRTLKGKK